MILEFLLWLLVTALAIYLASLLVVGRRASFVGALAAAIATPIIFVLVFYLVALVGLVFLKGYAPLAAFFAAFLAALGVFASALRTDIARAILIAVLSILIAWLIWNILLPVQIEIIPRVLPVVRLPFLNFIYSEFI